MLLCCWPLPSACSDSTINRCRKYYPQVIRESRVFAGMDAPAYAFMGQIETESRCNAGITAFDGGMGLSQFMPATARWLQRREDSLQEISSRAAPYNPNWAIRALIIYDRQLYDQTSCRDWHFAFRAYNGGLGNLNKEIKQASSCDPALVAKHCHRKILKLKNGGTLNLCQVNISYPRKVFQAGEKYRRAQ